MSIVAYFYTFNKRRNSTKVVTNDDLKITSEITLKEPTSLHTPSIILAVGADDVSKALAVNYVKFNTAYYWIENTTILSNTHFQFDCRIDLLATYNAEILATKAYILYSANGSKQLTDNRLGIRHDFEYTQQADNLSDMFQGIYQLKYLLSTIGDNGLATSFMLTTDQMILLGSELSGADVLNELAQYFANPWDSINGVSLTPIDLPSGATTKNISLGNYTATAVGYQIDPLAVKQQSITFDLSLTGDFRDSSIATVYYLLLPYIGVVPLDSDIIYDATSIKIEATAEIVTGSIIYIISAYRSLTGFNQIATFSGNCNSSMSFSRTTANIGQSISALATGVWGAGSIIAGNPFGISGLSHAMVEGVLAQRQAVQTNGTISSAIGRYTGITVYLYKFRHYSQMEPNEIIDILGIPTFKCSLLSTCSGYVQTANASVSAIATSDELQEINSLLDGGVYIE